jgi:hypothetical protein
LFELFIWTWFVISPCSISWVTFANTIITCSIITIPIINTIIYPRLCTIATREAINHSHGYNQCQTERYYWTKRIKNIYMLNRSIQLSYFIFFKLKLVVACLWREVFRECNEIFCKKAYLYNEFVGKNLCSFIN